MVEVSPGDAQPHASVEEPRPPAQGKPLAYPPFPWNCSSFKQQIIELKELREERDPLKFLLKNRPEDSNERRAQRNEVRKTYESLVRTSATVAPEKVEAIVKRAIKWLFPEHISTNEIKEREVIW